MKKIIGLGLVALSLMTVMTDPAEARLFRRNRGSSGCSTCNQPCNGCQAQPQGMYDPNAPQMNPNAPQPNAAPPAQPAPPQPQPIPGKAA